MTIPQAFELALTHHRAGRLAEAEALYRQILAAQPNHADARRCLGVIAHQAGRHDLAVEWIRQAIALHPNNPAAHSNLAEAYGALGRFDEAAAAYRRAIQLKPDFYEALIHLGNTLGNLGKHEEAMAAFRRAVQLRPDSHEAHYNLGNTLSHRGQLDEAIASYRQALELKPDSLEALNNLGNALREKGHFAEAIAACRRALALQPDCPALYVNLSAALSGLGELDAATAACRRALEIQPDFPEALNNLGTALGARGLIDEALAVCRRALELRPDCPRANNNLGAALGAQGLLDEAVAAYRRALQAKPDFTAAQSNLIFTLHFHPGSDVRAISEEHDRWNRHFSAPLQEFLQRQANDRAAAGRKLRVGYVSPDFRNHAVGRYALPLFERHDREQFEILCYSGVLQPDWMTERLRALAGEWRNTVGVSDARLAEMIRADQVDILVDLAMHTAGNRLPVFARQPAPVQVAWLAYPGSTGLPGMGYRLTDAHLDPPGSRSCGTAWSAEEPVRLPDCWCCYQPADDSPEINPLPAFSAEGLTFGSLNNFAKVNEGALALWARVLAAAPGSRLLMFCPEGSARERVLACFHQRGIAPERVVLTGFLPRWEYLQLYQRIDLALDPFPCNGMTTTCDALWMGVPVVTLAGEMPVSRAGLSILSTIGLAEMAAYSEDDYVRLAVKLAGNLPRLAELRATLRPRMLASPLMDAPRFARNVEAAYWSMWEQNKG